MPLVFIPGTGGLGPPLLPRDRACAESARSFRFARKLERIAKGIWLLVYGDQLSGAAATQPRRSMPSVGHRRFMQIDARRVRVGLAHILRQQVAIVQCRVGSGRVGIQRCRSAIDRSKVRDHFAMTTVATLLPMVLQVAMAIDMKR